MKKKGVLLIFIILAVLHHATAETEKSIFSGYICSGNSTKVGNDVFIARLGRDTSRVSVTLPTNSILIIDYGTCEQEDDYKVCYTESDICYHDYAMDKDIAKVKLVITKVIADVSLTRLIEPTTMIVGDTAKITTRLINNGGRAADNVGFADAFPDFMVFDVEGCGISDDTVLWTGELGINQEKKCTYSIKALSNFSYSSRANLSYNNGIENKSISDTASIVVSGSQIEIKNFVKKNIEVNEEFQYNISIKNINVENDITISVFEVSFPIDIEIINKDSLMQKSISKYTWRGNLRYGESQLFQFKLKGNKAGVFRLNERADYTIKSRLAKASSSLDVNISYPIPVLNLTLRNSTLKGGDRGRLSLIITNPSTMQAFKEVEVEIRANITDIAGKTKILAGIKPQEKIEAINREFMAPFIDATSSFQIEAVVRYKVDEEIVSAGKSLSFIVMPGAKPRKEIRTATLNTSSTAKKKAEEEDKSIIKERLNATISKGIEIIKEEGLSKRVIIGLSGLAVAIIVINIFIFIRKRRRDERRNERISMQKDQEKQNTGGNIQI